MNPTDRDHLTLLLGPAGPDIGCDACFAGLDRYAELVHAGADPEPELPGMRSHLAACPACDEEYKSLMDLIRADEEIGGRG